MPVGHLYVSFGDMSVQVFTSLVKFIPRHFILFDVILNGIYFLLSLSGSSLLVYKKVTDFCALILHPATLLNLFKRRCTLQPSD